MKGKTPMTRTVPEMQAHLSFFNTMGRKRENFVPIKEGEVSVYCCGPTVYNYQHIGNMRAYIFEDVLVRTLRLAGLQVTHAMNITDVGHLVSDADEGEDKMLVASRREGKSSMEIAEYYTNQFFDDCDQLSIVRPNIVCRATDHIREMIDSIQILEENGFTYQSGGNVYFSIDKFPNYGALSGVSLKQQEAGSRVDVDERKRNPLDFVLWFTESKFEGQELQWDSPWGRGYPGWHIECSSMALKYLGERIDIHCGGIDHIGVHHSNEIAQAEACTGNTWVNLWLHSAFLIDSDGKMSKAKGEFLTLKSLKERGYDPSDYRYFCLGAHYRTELSFSWVALDQAKASVKKLRRQLENLSSEIREIDDNFEFSPTGVEILEDFQKKLASDLNTPQALAVMHTMLANQNIRKDEKIHILLLFDEVLGLGFREWIEKKEEIPEEVMSLAKSRAEARTNKDWAEADRLRDEIQRWGFLIEDSNDGIKLVKNVK